MNDKVIYIIVISIVTFFISLKGYKDDDGLRPMYVLIMGFAVACCATMLWLLTTSEWEVIK